MRVTVRGLDGRELQVWTLDYETYYNTKEKYSLRTMTTTNYVRDKRFRAHMLSAIDPTGRTYAVMHDEIPAFLAGIDWKNSAFLAHNTYFDGFITSEIYGYEAAYYLDTLSMSLGEFGHNVRHSLDHLAKRLGLSGKIKGVLEGSDGTYILSPEQEEVLAEYAIVDSEQCLKCFKLLKNDRLYPEGELDVIDVTIKAFVRPKLMVDKAMCDAEIEEDKLNLERLYNLVIVDVKGLGPKCVEKFAEKGLDGILGSSPCFAALLRQRGVEPPLKRSPSNPDNMIFAFGKTDIGLQRMQQDPRVSDLVNARLGVKSTIRRTRAERFLLDTLDGERPLPVPLKYCGAKTHRWSGMGSINLQNLPSGKGGSSSRLRQSIMAPPGWRIVVVDASQIECRFNAWVWGQNDLVQLFAEGGDPYSQLASAQYGVPVGKHGPNQHLRPHGKAMELGLGYGMGVDKYYDSCLTGAIIGIPLELTEQEAEKAIATYRGMRNKIVQGWSTLNEDLAFMATAGPNDSYQRGPWTFYRNAVEMPNGLMMHYPNLRYETRLVKGVRKEKDDDGNTIEVPYEFLRTELVYTVMGQDIRIWGSKFDENLVQSSTRTIVAQRAIEIAKEFPVCLLVHDEVVYLAREHEADEALEFGLKTLRVAPEWCATIPLDAEGGHSQRYDVK